MYVPYPVGAQSISNGRMTSVQSFRFDRKCGGDDAWWRASPRLPSRHSGPEPESSRRASARRERLFSAQGLGLAGYRLKAGM